MVSLPPTAEHDIPGRVVPGDKVVAGTGPHNVPAGHAADLVVTCSAVHHVVTLAGVDVVISSSTEQGVVPVAALERVIASEASDDVIAAQSGQQVIPCRAVYDVVVVVRDGDKLTPDFARAKLARMDIEVEFYRRSRRGRTEIVGEVVDCNAHIRAGRVVLIPDAAQRPGAIRIKLNSKVVVVLLISRSHGVDLPEDNGSVYARSRSVKMRAGDIVVGRRRLR